LTVQNAATGDELGTSVAEAVTVLFTNMGIPDSVLDQPLTPTGKASP